MRRRDLSLVLIGVVASSFACGRQVPPATTALVIEPTVVKYADNELGSFSNPVKASGPFGQREFLRRLVCPSGGPPTFDREGSFGEGADGHMRDGYDVECVKDGIRAFVFMDMYHAGYRERASLRPFQVLAELPARTAQGCPPRVHVNPDSSAKYVFDFLEVETPAEPINKPEADTDLSRNTPVSFVVNTQGTPESETIHIPEWTPDSIKPEITSRILALRFHPALHHDSCRVRQRVAIWLRSAER